MIAVRVLCTFHTDSAQYFSCQSTVLLLFLLVDFHCVMKTIPGAISNEPVTTEGLRTTGPSSGLVELSFRYRSEISVPNQFIVGYSFENILVTNLCFCAKNRKFVFCTRRTVFPCPRHKYFKMSWGNYRKEWLKKYHTLSILKSLLENDFQLLLSLSGTWELILNLQAHVNITMHVFMSSHVSLIDFLSNPENPKIS